MFKECNKCGAKFLLFHLKSDCKFAKEKMDWLKTKVKDETINSDTLLKDMELTSEADEKANFTEYSRWNSVPLLFALSCFIFGILALQFGSNAIGNVLTGAGGVFFLVYAVFLVQGGFNLIFKMIIMRDLLKEYHPKEEERFKQGE